jgi:hypothetical protein
MRENERFWTMNHNMNLFYFSFYISSPSPSPSPSSYSSYSSSSVASIVLFKAVARQNEAKVEGLRN